MSEKNRKQRNQCFDSFTILEKKKKTKIVNRGIQIPFITKSLKTHSHFITKQKSLKTQKTIPLTFITKQKPHQKK